MDECIGDDASSDNARLLATSSRLTNLTIVSDSPTGLDFAVDNIGLMPTVPEPSTPWLGLTGSDGMGATFRRRLL